MDKKFWIGNSLSMLTMISAVFAAWNDSREDIVALQGEVKSIRDIEQSRYNDLTAKIVDVSADVKEVQRQLELSEERQSKQLDRIERMMKH